MTFILPTFQAQNPAISGYSLGWASCTAFAGAMAAAFDQGRSFVMKGGALREMTGDHTGGLNLAQVDAALLKGWEINVNTTYRLPWADFARAINAGKGGILQGWYGPIADSRYDAGRGFRGNHAVTVLPGWIGMDPLADGRAEGVYKYHGEVYPQALLRSFAGKLNIGGTGYQALGDGLVYCSLTRDKVASYRVTIRPLSGNTYRTFARHYVTNGVAAQATTSKQTKGFQLPCSEPHLYPIAGTSNRVSLVRISNPGRAYDGWYVSTRWAEEA